MGLFRKLNILQRLLVGLLLTVFVLNVATASHCCDMGAEMTASEMMSPELMPCHGDDPSDQSGECCVSCVMMVLGMQVQAVPSVVQPASTSPQLPELLLPPGLLYRPPICHLS